MLAALIGTAGFVGITQTDHAMDQIVETSKILTKNLEADMMHDALRADVFLSPEKMKSVFSEEESTR